VVGILNAGRVSIAAVGRAMRSAVAAKHRIKRVDRLLGNARLRRERGVWFAALAAALLGRLRRVVVLVDWTQLNGGVQALCASVPFFGRSVPIYIEAHPERLLGNRQIQARFLNRLAKILPAGCRATIVADAGFHTPFFSACRAVGFDFVIRLRGRGIARRWNDQSDDELVPFTKLFRLASDKAKCLGQLNTHVTTTDNSRVVLGPKPRRRRGAADPYRRRAMEPYLLATSLENEPAEQIVELYSTRMQIEELFRDNKSSRFGWALDLCCLHSAARYDAILLLVAIATAAAVLAGAAAEGHGAAKMLQANTTRARRVLSLFTVGNLVLRGAACVQLGLRSIRAELRKLHAEMRRQLRPPPKTRAPTPLPHDLFCADCGENFEAYGWPT
jgi:hypothetical protein